MGREEKILSVQDVLHLQSDKHTKADSVIPEVDNSRYVLSQKQKTQSARNFTPVINITEEQRKQFNKGSSSPSKNTLLAERARNALKVAEMHAKEEAAEQAKVSAEKTDNSIKIDNELAKEMKNGSFDFGFGALTEGSANLKETI